MASARLTGRVLSLSVHNSFFLMRGPGIKTGQVQTGELAANIDIA